MTFFLMLLYSSKEKHTGKSREKYKQIMTKYLTWLLHTFSSYIFKTSYTRLTKFVFIHVTETVMNESVAVFLT